MDIEYTITISKADLQALYKAYLLNYYEHLQVQSVEMQKEMAEQKERVEKIINRALEADGNN